MDNSLYEYRPPKWAQHLPHIPKWKVQLGHLNTPIQRWNLPGIPDKFTLSIKRDDMTGCVESGNKVRKLEFIMAEALSQNCEHVITVGAKTSNQCRAVAACARQLGLQLHLIIKSDIKNASELGCEGNLLLDKLCGANIYIVPPQADTFTEKKLQDEIFERINETTKTPCYFIPMGGSNLLGTWGYMEAFDEMVKQGLHDTFDDIVVTSGTGGTSAGIAIANYLIGSKLRVHGISIAYTEEDLHQHINDMLVEFGIEVKSEDIIDIIDGHQGEGYTISTQEELDFLVSVSTSTGIVLDRVFTGKAVKGLVHELNNSPNRFKGNRILFIHTGGIFGLYDGKINSTLNTKNV